MTPTVPESWSGINRRIWIRIQARPSPSKWATAQIVEDQPIHRTTLHLLGPGDRSWLRAAGYYRDYRSTLLRHPHGGYQGLALRESLSPGGRPHSSLDCCWACGECVSVLPLSSHCTMKHSGHTRVFCGSPSRMFISALQFGQLNAIV